jgi:hypothetical protein
MSPASSKVSVTSTSSPCSSDAGQAHEHHVHAAAFQQDRLTGGDGEAFLHMDHAHHVAIHDVGVQARPARPRPRTAAIRRSSESPMFMISMKAAPDRAMGLAARA